jgi:hypothetical protein
MARLRHASCANDQFLGSPGQSRTGWRKPRFRADARVFNSDVLHWTERLLKSLEDDRYGGGALSLRYVSSELRSVIDLVEYANYEPQVGKQLLTIVADLAQLLGWLQFDSGRYGAAERYLLLSVGVCRCLGARDRAANVIGMLGYVSSFAGHGVEALRLVDAASRECIRPYPILCARLLGREATAAAADGDLDRFRRASEMAMQLLIRHRNQEPPPFLYYLAPDQLAAEAGQGLVVLAERTSAHRKRLLNEAVDTLTTAVADLTSAVRLCTGRSRVAQRHIYAGFGIGAGWK